MLATRWVTSWKYCKGIHVILRSTPFNFHFHYLKSLNLLVNIYPKYKIFLQLNNIKLLKEQKSFENRQRIRFLRVRSMLKKKIKGLECYNSAKSEQNNASTNTSCLLIGTIPTTKEISLSSTEVELVVPSAYRKVKANKDGAKKSTDTPGRDNPHTIQLHWMQQRGGS